MDRVLETVRTTGNYCCCCLKLFYYNVQLIQDHPQHNLDNLLVVKIEPCDSCWHVSQKLWFTDHLMGYWVNSSVRSVAMAYMKCRDLQEGSETVAANVYQKNTPC